jgi:4-hydroxy-tetrahydrodipicolinate synthase
VENGVPSDKRFGLSAALTTPFTSQGQIDVARAVAHARWCLDNGCSSVTVFGTTGEGSSIGRIERRELLGAFLANDIAPAQVVVGVMANSLQDAADQARQAIDAGCRGILLAPPSYYKNVTDDGLFAWFSGVLTKLGTSARDFFLYNIPAITAVELSVSLIGRLRAAFPHAVAGVKDSSGDWNYSRSLLEAHRDLAILIGDERCLAAGVRLGAEGAISGMANVCPLRMLPIVYEGRGDPVLDDLVDALLAYPVTPAVKALVAHRTHDNGWLATRAPLVTISDGDARHLAGLLDRMQLTAAV